MRSAARKHHIRTPPCAAHCASIVAHMGELKCRAWLDRVTLEPPGPEATELRQWWASRPAGYVAPSVTMHPLVTIEH
jgi:hypothetical protein